ncbi:methyl-accepting chemotaxis protein [Marinicellulosiphila megalodicopiae]|uniref:methyl-accepting chemotaxis protein n=1 Tax=Marinicellulosiphila megalodicopiae TaxID=2724896 RepID=UPI003BB1B9F9
MKPITHFFTLKSKIITGFGLLSIIILLVGIAGIFGLKQMAKHFEFVTGPAWDTADGAMEGTIGIEAEIIAIENILAGRDYESNIAALNDGIAMEEESLGRMEAAGLIPQKDIAIFNEYLNTYKELRNEIISGYLAFSEVKVQFDANAAKFIEFGEILEEIGDKAVDAIADNPDELWSWSTGLEKRWMAADGGMESNIGLLWSMYQMNLLINESNPEKVKLIYSEVTQALAFLAESVGEMKKSGFFKAKPGSTWGNKSYIDTYTDFYNNHKKLSAELFEKSSAYHDVHHRYQQSANSLLTQLEVLESNGDATVESFVTQVYSLQKNINLIMLSVLIGGLVVALISAAVLISSIINPIKTILSRLKNIAEGDGDLTKRIEQKGTDEIGQLAAAFNLFVDNIHKIIKQVKVNATDMSSSMLNLQKSTTQAANSVEEQSSETDQIATAFTEMNQTSKVIADATEIGSHNANLAKEASSNAQVIVGSAIETIEVLAGEIDSASEVIGNLESDVTKIVSVLDVIKGIAEQTNLLALNAAIEAARAGEQGRGFAVVADEVRALASKTQDSTSEIQSMIDRLKSGSSQAVNVMQRSKERGQETVTKSTDVKEILNQISDLVAQMYQSNIEVASNSQDQSTVSEQMDKNVQRIVDISIQTRERMKESSTVSTNVTAMSEQMMTAVSRFNV